MFSKTKQSLRCEFDIQSFLSSDGPLVGSVVGPANKNIVKEALNAFFLEQNQSGLWDKGRGDSICD